MKNDAAETEATEERAKARPSSLLVEVHTGQLLGGSHRSHREATGWADGSGCYDWENCRLFASSPCVEASPDLASPAELSQGFEVKESAHLAPSSGLSEWATVGFSSSHTGVEATLVPTPLSELEQGSEGSPSGLDVMGESPDFLA